MQRRPIRVGLNVLPEDGYRLAAIPLFEKGLVDAVEWDCDERWRYGWGNSRMPTWINPLLDLYGKAGALYGHAVWMSVLSARQEPRHERWFSLLAKECKRREYKHVTEHLGFITAGAFEGGTIFSAPLRPEVVAVGRANVARLAKASRRPVGLENWSNSLGLPDIVDQGELLEAILEPHGILVLDLHNIHTQAVNLGYPAEKILESLPLARAREIHIAGGDWYESKWDPRLPKVRIDTHDGAVPEEVFQLLPLALRKCPNLEVVFLERRGNCLYDEAEREMYQADFLRIREIVAQGELEGPAEAPPSPTIRLDRPKGTVDQFAAYQAELLEILASGLPPDKAIEAIVGAPACAPYRDYSSALDPRMIEVTCAQFQLGGQREDPQRLEFLRRYPKSA